MESIERFDTPLHTVRVQTRRYQGHILQHGIRLGPLATCAYHANSPGARYEFWSSALCTGRQGRDEIKVDRKCKTQAKPKQNPGQVPTLPPDRQICPATPAVGYGYYVMKIYNEDSDLKGWIYLFLPLLQLMFKD